MPVPIHRKITRWIIDRLLWDPTGATLDGFWGGLWATRKLLIALAGSAWLTWLEWTKNHPPEIAIVALMHFVFVLAVIALAVQIGRWLRRGDKTSPGR
jgi:hypothetical protein